jgi:5'-nucleotidase
VHGVALSAPVEDEAHDYGVLDPWVETVLRVLVDDGPLLVNVNFPPGEPRDVRWTRQAVDQYDGRVVPATDPMGRDIYWFTVVPLERHAEGTDLWAFEHGYVSLTPLRLDLTDGDALARVGQVP